MATYRRNYRNVFFAHNGPGPYTCCFCGDPVTFEEVLVHHRDEDHSNDDSENLAASHTSCHHRHHKHVENIRGTGGSHLHRPGCKCPFCVPRTGDDHPSKSATARASMSAAAKKRAAREREQGIGRWAK